MTDAVTPTGPVTRGSVARVATATAITAVCGYAVLYLAARALDPAGFSVFAVFWGAFGLVTGAANGLLQQSTREVRLALHARSQNVGPVTHPIRVAAAVGTVSAVLIAATAILWSPHVFVESPALSVLLLSVGLGCFCLHATLLGMLAGANQWSQYGALMVTDAVIRVLIAILAVTLDWGLVGFLWATVGGALSWLLVLMASPSARTVAQLVARENTASFLRGAAHAVAAAGASAILVMGFPVLLKATSSDLGAVGGVLILAVTLTRAPLLVPLTAMQGNLIAHFVDTRQHRLRAVARAVGLLTLIGGIGVALAALTGPWLMRAGFGDDYRADGALLAWLTVGAVAVAVLTVTGAATVAAALHRAYSLGWVGATVAAALLLTLPLDLQTRAVVALTCGPLVGIAVHLAALARIGQQPRVA